MSTLVVVGEVVTGSADAVAAAVKLASAMRA